ncbi:MULTISPECIES: MauE/DoxX family redox-associated membrane protein [unclassified Nocardioides]|uniref:MauE/DoxX family redox-associated membrane protein n=1 Tax=unclassified Nocardioides TaxID=2615069 RepID=UPI0000571425|nr:MULTISPECIES: MauE/DoxX family redox-associated membrane protein [unclassified Nocardioides]ABL80866.1 DoxX family protein [Nocardioides sp. JS614]
MATTLTGWLGLLARLVTGGVWIAAGAVKLPDPAQSVDAVRAYQLLPASLVEPVGQLLPVVEIVVGATLVLGLLTRGSAIVSALLFAAFIIGIASVWARGITIDCGCFGGGGYDPDAASKYPWEIARDGALLIASLFVAWLPTTRLALDSVLFGRVPEPEGP